MVFLHLTSPPPPREAGGGSSGDLPEMLFMFSVSAAPHSCDSAMDGDFVLA
jgi:hypothetical protein